MNKKLPIPTEYQECRAYYDWAMLQPNLRQCLIHIPNEGIRHPIVGRRLKLIGLRPGIPDYCIPIKTPKYGSLWLEVKRSSKSNISTAQEEFVDLLKDFGHFAKVVYGANEAIEVTLDYLSNKL